MAGPYSQISQSPDGFYDAFGRVRSGNPATLFDSQMQYDKQPLLWVEKTAGTASITHQPNESAVDLTLGTASGDRIVRQTREYLRYQPGKSQLVLATFTLGEAQAGTTKLIGYGDDANGVFVGQDGGGLFILLRSNTTGTPSDARKVYQADWNRDPLNGSGAASSGLVLDPTKPQIAVIDMEWLGVGRVRVGFNVDGVTYYAHEFLNANRFGTTTYMTTANLPVRYEVVNTGAVAAAPTLKQICCSVTSEGGVEDTLAYPFSTELIDVSLPNGAANAEVIFAARHALTFNGIVNRSTFQPLGYEVSAVGGQVVTRVVYNPIITAGTWGAVDANSAMEGSSDIGANFSGGINTGTAIIAAGANKTTTPVFGKTVTSRLPFGLDVDGANPIALALVAYATTNNVTASFAFQWEELR